MTFRRPALSRCVTFAEVAAETRLPEEEVELLVMKALAQNLVRGHIDQVDRTVNLVWVQPRVLDKNQVPSAPPGPPWGGGAGRGGRGKGMGTSVVVCARMQEAWDAVAASSLW